MKADNLAVGLVEAVLSVALLWGLQNWGPKPLGKEKTFKETHQTRTLSDSRDDDAPQDFR